MTHTINKVLAYLLVGMSYLAPAQAQYPYPSPYSPAINHPNPAPQPNRVQTNVDRDKAASAMQRGDYAIAYCLYQPAAKGGDAEAQYTIGWMYANGYGLAVDETKALTWWRKAAEQGHGDATFAVAAAYMDGEGTDKDMQLAMDWMIKAARKKVDDAVEIILFQASRGEPAALALLESDIQSGEGILVKERRWVKVPRANVRKAPNKTGKLLTTLSQGDALMYLGTEGNWVRIGIVGSTKVGWIYKSLLSETKPD